MSVNLTTLAEARAKMRSARYDTDEFDVGLAATHNAADVLIEVARAAKALQVTGWDFRSPTMDDLLAALAKVTL